MKSAVFFIIIAGARTIPSFLSLVLSLTVECHWCISVKAPSSFCELVPPQSTIQFTENNAKTSTSCVTPASSPHIGTQVALGSAYHFHFDLDTEIEKIKLLSNMTI